MDCRDIRYSNAPAFQAQIKVRGLKLDAEKLAQVNEIVMNKSQHYANDVIELNGFSARRNNGTFFHSMNFSLNGEDVGAAVAIGFKNFFEDNSANDIAKVILRILKKGKANEIFKNRLDSIRRNITSAMAGELHCARKINSAIARKDYFQTKIHENLSLNFQNRIKALKEQRKNLENLHDEISEKITDTPISNIIYWD